MRNLMLVTGLSSIMVLAFAACGSDVVETSTQSTSSSGVGGSGGASVSSSSSNSSVSSSSGAGGTDPGNVCDQACEKLAVECATGLSCDIPQVSDILDCADPASECPGQCVLDADCSELPSVNNGFMFGANLQACVQLCQGGGGGAMPDCQGCLVGNCLNELMACGADMASPCAAFLNCAAACPAGDGVCYDGCAQGNPSPETTAVVNCATANCTNDCGLSGVGGAGVGGNGGV